MTKFSHHNPIIKLINDKEIKSMVEIGVWRGWLAENILLECPRLERYIGIDPWIPYGQKVAEDWDKIAKEVTESITADDRAAIIRKTSSEASLDFEKKSVELVFIDGDHSHAAVSNDTELWTPIASRVICGHDWSGKWSVKKVVEKAFDNVTSIGGNVWVVEL